MEDDRATLEADVLGEDLMEAIRVGDTDSECVYDAPEVLDAERLFSEVLTVNRGI